MSRSRMWRRRFGVAALAAAILTLPACSGGGDPLSDLPPTTTVPSAPPTPAPASSVEPSETAEPSIDPSSTPSPAGNRVFDLDKTVEMAPATLDTLVKLAADSGFNTLASLVELRAVMGDTVSLPFQPVLGNWSNLVDAAGRFNATASAKSASPVKVEISLAFAPAWAAMDASSGCEGDYRCAVRPDVATAVADVAKAIATRCEATEVTCVVDVGQQPNIGQAHLGGTPASYAALFNAVATAMKGTGVLVQVGQLAPAANEGGNLQPAEFIRQAVAAGLTNVDGVVLGHTDIITPQQGAAIATLLPGAKISVRFDPDANLLANVAAWRASGPPPDRRGPEGLMPLGDPLTLSTLAAAFN